MARAKVKDDLALLLTACIVSIIGWGIFQLLGMYTFLVGIAAWMYVSIRHWKRVPKKGLEKKEG